MQAISVADPDPGSGIRKLSIIFRTPDPGSGRGESQHQDPGPGMNNQNHIFKSIKTTFVSFVLGIKILYFLDEALGFGIQDGDSSDPGSGMGKSWIRDPGYTSRIRNKANYEN